MKRRNKSYDNKSHSGSKSSSGLFKSLNRQNHGARVTTIVAVVSLGCLLALQYKNNGYLAPQSASLTPPPPPPISSSAAIQRKGPFEMPLKGAAYDIFQPLYDLPESEKDKPILGSPSEMIQTFENRISWADSMVNTQPLSKGMSIRDHAKQMYVETIKNFVSGVVYGTAEYSVHARLRPKGQKLSASMLNIDSRRGGIDWTYAGDTMTGFSRLDNVYHLLKNVTDNGIEGDYMETGVWRGGSSVFAKAVMSALELDNQESTTSASGALTSSRVSYVCDSFQGLPPGDRSLDKGDRGWDNAHYLEVPAKIVANNFVKYDLLDSNVVFARGFFNETMPPLSKLVKSLAVMRLDGDMYESTVDVLYNMYDKLSIGGYVIMDDWYGFPSKTACEDFFAVHGIDPEIIRIDKISAYWKKTEHVDIQYWRYEQLKFKKDD